MIKVAFHICGDKMDYTRAGVDNWVKVKMLVTQSRPTTGSLQAQGL